MSMFWPDNSDLLGKKFFDHIVQSERRQEEFRDVLMKDVRRSSDQRVRNQIIRHPSENSSYQDQSSSFGERRHVARSSSHEARSFGEDRGIRHSEVYINFRAKSENGLKKLLRLNLFKKRKYLEERGDCKEEVKKP